MNFKYRFTGGLRDFGSISCVTQASAGSRSASEWNAGLPVPVTTAGCCLFGEEVQEGGVDDLGVGPGDVVRAAFDGDECQVLDQAGQPRGSGRTRQDPVSVAVH